MMIELLKEIELEYINSKIHDFTNVRINDENIEKRGAGHRMVFHCQGILKTRKKLYFSKILKCFL